MKIARALAASAAVIASSMFIGACGLVSNNGSNPGGSSTDAPAAPTLGKEFPAIRAAALAAHSVRIDGNVVQGGHRIRLNLALVKPSDAAGWVAKGRQRFAIIVASGHAYIRINRRFLRLAHLPSSVCGKACGKYLDAPASSAREFTHLSLARLMKSLFKDGVPAAEKNLKLKSAEFHGQPAWTVTGHHVTIYISKGTTPYLLSLTLHGQHVTFSDWNKATVTAPPARKVLTASQLGSLAVGG